MLEHLRSLAVFARTVELGSFRAAARALELSPSVVSHHINTLEGRLGVPLLHRSTRRLALTTDGERLFTAAREMVNAAERGLDALAFDGDTPRGKVRLTAPAYFAETAFCADLAAFSLAHPQVQATVAFSDARHDLLRDGLDLALRVGHLEDSALKVKALAHMERVLVVSRRALAGRAQPQTLAELATWDFVQLSVRAPEITLLPPGKRKPVTLAFQARIAVDSAAALRGLALAGAGVATVPEVLVRHDLARGTLVELLPDWRVAPVGVYAVWPAATQRPALVHHFLTFMAPRIASLFERPAR
jgi:DNA-binding transcriptional LysR family regulator